MDSFLAGKAGRMLLIQEPIAYDDQQIVEEDGIIYKTQHDELYKSVIPEQPIQQQQQQQPTKVLPQIQPDILNQFKVQDAILPPLQYKKLIPPPETSKQYYILRRPTSLHLQHQQEPPPQQQYNNKGGQDDSVTITQSQEIDVSSLPSPKFHSKYVATKPSPPVPSDHYPVSYQQQEEYDSQPLTQHHNGDDILGSGEETVREYSNVDDIDGELNNLLGSVSLSKSLPDKITPENLDSSIKTLSKLLRILQRANALPHSAKTLVSNLPRPREHQYKTKASKLAHKIPSSDQEGSTPGRAGVDYPAYDEIPHTHFSCKEQRYKGFFGDPETGCQVWHYCDLNGGQASFLCPNGTIFSQVALTCDWWFNVKCAATSQLYVLNERLYKYILPQKLSFPEDFQGPLVDQYLALKFKEIEEKNKNKTEAANNSSKEQEEEEEELPFSEDVATSLNKVRSIPTD
uniref:Chitin-binding type-2 domain-containing protein n=1 Tax=Rhodnius prolixus TaxID=13249 RepID=T1IF06_RHOPR